MKWISALPIALLLFTAQAWGQQCSITSVAVNFRGYSPLFPSRADSVGKIKVNCTAGLAYSVLFGPGQNTGGRFIPRKMRIPGGKGVMVYNLYINSARTRVWGDGTGLTFVQNAVGTGQEQTFLVYSRIPQRQQLDAGRYTDSIEVRVVF